MIRRACPPPRKPPPPRTKNALKRRAQVHYLVLTEGLTANQIGARLNCSPHTVKDDIRAMSSDTAFWLDAQARAGWGIQVQNMVSAAFNDIARLETMAAHIERDEKRMADEEAPTVPENPYDAKTEPREYLEFQRNAIQMEIARNTRRHHYGEYASLLNAVNRTRMTIKEFMDDLPLYAKVQELQLWLEQHEPLRPAGPSAVKTARAALPHKEVPDKK